jgi:hypothetical protein
VIVKDAVRDETGGAGDEAGWQKAKEEVQKTKEEVLETKQAVRETNQELVIAQEETKQELALLTTAQEEASKETKLMGWRMASLEVKMDAMLELLSGTSGSATGSQ